MVQNRNPAVDIAKYLAALLVIGIHTSLFSDLNDTLYFVAVQIVCRIAVPFFAVCTGYYLGSKLSFGDRLENANSNLSVFIHQWKKIFVLYFTWTCLYLVFSIPAWIQTGWFSPMAFVDYAVATMTSGSHYHLWYLLYLLYSLPLVYILLRLVPAKRQWLLISVCWTIAIFTYTYQSLFPTDILPSLGLLSRFSMFPVLPPLILLGVQISREEKRRDRRCYAIGLVISLWLLTAEALTLRHFGVEKVSFIICTLPTAYFLFHFVLELAQTRNVRTAEGAALLGSISVPVYCIHPMFVETVGKKIDSSVWTYLIVAFMSTVTGYVFYMMKRKIKEKRNNSCFN